ncbi:flagellar biosynthesis anti-sigma factor FlgM [Marinomonas sp. 2405UD68-3]|uniref:flagellar biosynthesis anti-sigma factor FlgM n=1 Tax=Marinomonas sp. 2405UD68-3 TaxID=3391835 RepID=UPI0039C96FC2
MAINLGNILNQSNVSKNDRLQKSSGETEGVKSKVPSNKETLAEDTVKLSGTAQVLKNQEEKISNLPDIDMDKVEEIKQALAAGEYKIDTQKLASNMQSIDALFS